MFSLNNFHNILLNKMNIGVKKKMLPGDMKYLIMPTNRDGHSFFFLYYVSLLGGEDKKILGHWLI